MNKKGILVLIGLFLFLGYISQNTGSGMKTAKAESTSSLCYQETANISTACGGLSSGKYSCSGIWESTFQPCSKVYDGNWGTSGAAASSNIAAIYINYTKPSNALISSLWLVKDDDASYPNGFNWTIPLNCWNQNPLRFKIESYLIPGELTGHAYECWDSSSWTLILNQTDSAIYEEAMWWNISLPSNTTLTLLSESSHNVTIYCNDTSGNMGQSYYTYFTINETPHWSNNQTNRTSTQPKINGGIQMNVTLTDNVNLSSYIFSWNGTTEGWKNDSSFDIPDNTTSLTISINKTINISHTIAWTVYFNDSVNNKNQTDIFMLEVINSIPTTPTLSSPLDLSSISVNYSILKYNSTDADNDIITFYIYNSSDNINFGLLFNGSGFINSIFNWSNLNDGNYYWKVKAGDIRENSSNSSVYKFTVSTNSPAITLRYPTNNLYLNNRNITSFNFTAQDANGLYECQLWHNLTGVWHKNQTNISIITNDGTTHYAFAGANDTTDERNYIYNVWCNDTTSNGNFYTSNFTFYIDTVIPNITITQPIGAKSSRTNIQARWTASDYSLNSCYFNIYRGINLEVANTSVVCSINQTTFNVSIGIADYIFYFYADDLAGNVGTSSSSFSVDTTSPPSPPSTGGAGGFKAIKEVSAAELPKPVELPPLCGDGICDEEESPWDCPRDCVKKLFDFNDIFCLPLGRCGNWEESWFINIIVLLTLGFLTYFMFLRKPGRLR